MRYWLARSAAVWALPALAFLLAVPAALPRSQAAARFDLWTGTWSVSFGYDGRSTGETITLALDSSGRVRNVGGPIAVLGEPSGLSLKAVLTTGTGEAAPPGQSVLRVAFRPADAAEGDDFREFSGAVYDLGGHRLATVGGVYAKGGPERAVVRPGIARSSRIADVGDKVEFRTTLTNLGPSGIQRGGARVRLTLNVAPANARLVPRRVRRCAEEQGRFAQQTIYDCLLLATGPTLGAPMVRAIVTVPRALADRRLDLDVAIADANPRDHVSVTGPARGAAITILPLDRTKPKPKPVVSLAGRWRGDDGGLFTITQRGREVRWTGRSADGGATWTHTFKGLIANGLLVGAFQDVAPGKARNKGALALKIVNRSRLDWVARGGGVQSFPTLTRRWTRCPQAGCPGGGGAVPFAEPRIVDRIKALGFQFEAFAVAACNPGTAGSCAVANPASDIRRRARAFCILHGTSRVAADTAGRRLGGREAPYAGESAANPGTVRSSRPSERWVDPLNGFVSYTAAATVFSSINCRAAA